MNGLDSNSYGMTKRTNNFEALFLEWFKSPLWGNGLNSYSTVSLASGTTKWAYEIVYVALLSQKMCIRDSIQRPKTDHHRRCI